MNLPLWFIYAISSILALAFAEVLQKHNIVGSKLSVSSNNFLVGVFQAIFGIIYLLLFIRGFSLSITPFLLIILILNAILAYIAFTIYYQSYKGESAGISNILYTSSVLLSAPLGILVFKESTSPYKFLGIFIVLLSIALLHLSKKEKFSKYNWYALVGGLLSGIVLTTDKLLTTLMDIRLLQVVYVLTYLVVTLFFRPDTFKELKTINWSLCKRIILVALCYFIFNKFILLAYSVGGEVGKVDVVNNSSIFVIILLETIILKDRSNLFKKLFSALLVFIGFYFLVQR